MFLSRYVITNTCTNVLRTNRYTCLLKFPKYTHAFIQFEIIYLLCYVILKNIISWYYMYQLLTFSQFFRSIFQINEIVIKSIFSTRNSVMPLYLYFLVHTLWSSIIRLTIVSTIRVYRHLIPILYVYESILRILHFLNFYSELDK